MSHFCVLVFGDDVDGQLQPWMEYDGDPDGNQVEIDIMEEVLADAREKGMDPVECAREYHDLPLLPAGEEPVLSGRHRFGWHTVDAEGRLATAVRYDNPNGKWDWHVVGGRWGAWLRTKDGGSATSARLGDIDFDAMRAGYEEAAAAKWDALEKAVGDIPFRTWKEIAAAQPDVEKARAEYHGQEASRRIDGTGMTFILEDPLATLRIPRDEYVRREGLDGIVPFAVVRDGKWMAGADMGWWGVTSNERPAGEWPEMFMEIISGADPDEMVTVVDCHI